MIERQLLTWYKTQHRKLPWRKEAYFYKVWISEIMLQQTRVKQMTAFYHRFMEKFPSLESLARAEEEEVLKKWEGLGYYSRARNLHFTARYIYFDKGNQPPNSFTALKKLKGIGDYTAAAIASICYKEPVCAVDGNVFRVFSRFFDIQQDIRLPKTRKYFFELGNQIISKENPGDFNQALMELGAMICLPGKAKCEICPIQNGCAAFAKNKVHLLPIKSKKAKVTQRFLNYFYPDKGFLFEKRVKKDIWQNLYQFPLIETDSKVHYFEKVQGLKVESIVLKKTIHHVLTHQKLIIQFWKIALREEDWALFAKNRTFVGFEQVKSLKLPVPKIFSDFIIDNPSNF